MKNGEMFTVHCSFRRAPGRAWRSPYSGWRRHWSGHVAPLAKLSPLRLTNDLRWLRRGGRGDHLQVHESKTAHMRKNRRIGSSRKTPPAGGVIGRKDDLQVAGISGNRRNDCCATVFFSLLMWFWRRSRPSGARTGHRSLRAGTRLPLDCAFQYVCFGLSPAVGLRGRPSKLFAQSSISW